MRIFGTIIIVILILGVAVGGFLGYRLFEGAAPVIVPKEIPSVLGAENTISVQVTDKGTGLTLVTAEIIQGNRSVAVGSENFEKGSLFSGSGVNDTIAEWVVRPKDLGLSQGKAILRITARDASLRNGFSGNVTVAQAPLTIDIKPPVITVLSSVHNVRVGGAMATSFRVDEEVEGCGVRVDSFFFPAYRGKDGVWRCIWGIPYNLDRPGKVAVEAVDRARNRASARFSYRVLARKKVRDRINISDSFLSAKMPDFITRYPDLSAPTLLETFLKVNRHMRSENNRFLLSLTSKTVPEVLWQGRFVRFKGAPKAGFADERHYFYKGREIDQAFHMGVDIASIARAQVPAANSGRVVFSGYNGIYGNTVVIDHGLGLMSLYAHLSSLAVKEGDQVAKGQTIGRTGTTGLAGGDHLHFGMMAGAIFINPVEWWDRRWIDSHIVPNLMLSR